MSNRLLRSLVVACAFGAVVAIASALAENIDPNNTQAQYAWGENVGWINAEPQGNGGPGVTVSGLWLTGYMWGENIGWINLNCQNNDANFDDICQDTGYYGVYNNGTGELSGYAWGENVGWISFSCKNGTTPCNQVGNYGVFIDPATGVWSGAAWGENIGWINFSHNQAGNRIDTADDGDGIAWPADNCPFDSNPGAPQTNTDAGNTALGLPGADTLGDACDPDIDGDGCHNLEEQGVIPDPGQLQPEFGNDRDPLDPWDFFEVTDDKAIDLQDTLAILARFGANPGDGNYSPRYDRQIDAVKKYLSAAATGDQIGIDLSDALNNLQSFGHSCAGHL